MSSGKWSPIAQVDLFGKRRNKKEVRVRIQIGISGIARNPFDVYGNDTFQALSLAI